MEADLVGGDVWTGAGAGGQLPSWGIKRGDRVALVSENRWEWPVMDFAVLAMGAVDVPLYQTLTPEQMGYILRDSGARALLFRTASSTRSSGGGRDAGAGAGGRDG